MRFVQRHSCRHQQSSAQTLDHPPRSWNFVLKLLHHVGCTETVLAVWYWQARARIFIETSICFVSVSRLVVNCGFAIQHDILAASGVQFSANAPIFAVPGSLALFLVIVGACPRSLGQFRQDLSEMAWKWTSFCCSDMLG